MKVYVLLEVMWNDEYGYEEQELIDVFENLDIAEEERIKLEGKFECIHYKIVEKDLK